MLKHLGVSRSAIGAVFVTALTLQFGHSWAPKLIPEIPASWKWVVTGAFVFSGFLLAFWAMAGFWKWSKAVVSSKRDFKRSLVLSPLERSIIVFMGQNPSEWLDLEAIDYNRLGVTKAKVFVCVEELKQKGLIDGNHFVSGNRVFLTKRGVERAAALLPEPSTG